MGKQSYSMDFTLKEASEYSRRLTFRFYCSASHMHGFRDEPPKDYSEVYKVYYSWAIVKGTDEYDGFVPMFTMTCDECSALFGLEDVIRIIVSYTDNDENTYEEHSIMSVGQPGSIWEIVRKKRGHFDEEEWVEPPENDVIRFSVWNNYNNKGYRFYLTLAKAAEFAEYIEKMNQYMLEHGEPI